MLKELFLRNKILITGVVGFFISYFLATPLGLELTPDSFQFLNAAKSFRERGVLEEIGGGSFVHWPPLFPTILSFFEHPTEVMYWLNPLMWGGVLVIWSKLLLKEVKKPIYQWMGILLISLNVSNVLLTRFLWVESVFVLLISLFIYFYFFDNWKFSWLICLLTGVAMVFLRTASILILINVVLLSLFDSQNRRKLWLFAPLIICWLGYRLFFSHRGAAGEFSVFDLESVINHLTWYYGHLRSLFLPLPGGYMNIWIELVFVVGFCTFLVFKRNKLTQMSLVLVVISFLYIDEVMLLALVKGFGGQHEVGRYLGVVSIPIFVVFVSLFERIHWKFSSVVVIVVLALNVLRLGSNLALWGL